MNVQKYYVIVIVFDPTCEIRKNGNNKKIEWDSLHSM